MVGFNYSWLPPFAHSLQALYINIIAVYMTVIAFELFRVAPVNKIYKLVVYPGWYGYIFGSFCQVFFHSVDFHQISELLRRLGF